MQDHPQYRQGRCYSWVCDVTQDWQPTFPPDSLDVVTLIFVLVSYTLSYPRQAAVIFLSFLIIYLMLMIIS